MNTLLKLKMDEEKAFCTSRRLLIEADMMGHSTHGVGLLPMYVNDIEVGKMNLRW